MIYQKQNKMYKITFGSGKDAITHEIEAADFQSLQKYLAELWVAGWDLNEITKIKKIK